MERRKSDLVSSVRTQYYQKLRNFLLRYVDQNLVEDVIQDTCVKVATRLHQLRDLAHFESWLFMIAKREALQKIRKCRRELNIAILCDKPVGNSYAYELPDLKRHDELRLLVEGYSIREIAKMKNVNEGTVKSRIFRSRLALKTTT